MKAIDEYDEETQGAIRKIMWDQDQKAKVNLPLRTENMRCTVALAKYVLPPCSRVLKLAKNCSKRRCYERSVAGGGKPCRLVGPFTLVCPWFAGLGRPGFTIRRAAI